MSSKMPLPLKQRADITEALALLASLHQLDSNERGDTLSKAPDLEYRPIFSLKCIHNAIIQPIKVNSWTLPPL